MLCECSVSFLWHSSDRPLQHQRGSFRSFACRGCLIFEIRLPHQVARFYFALVDLALGSLRFKGDILFVSAEVFISPVGLIDAVLTVMC